MEMFKRECAGREASILLVGALQAVLLVCIGMTASHVTFHLVKPSLLRKINFVARCVQCFIFVASAQTSPSAAEQPIPFVQRLLLLLMSFHYFTEEYDAIAKYGRNYPVLAGGECLVRFLQCFVVCGDVYRESGTRLSQNFYALVGASWQAGYVCILASMHRGFVLTLVGGLALQVIGVMLEDPRPWLRGLHIAAIAVRLIESAGWYVLGSDQHIDETGHITSKSYISESMSTRPPLAVTTLDSTRSLDLRSYFGPFVGNFRRFKPPRNLSFYGQVYGKSGSSKSIKFADDPENGRAQRFAAAGASTRRAARDADRDYEATFGDGGKDLAPPVPADA